MQCENPKCSLSNNLIYFQEFGHQEDILGVAYTPPHFLATSSYDGMVGCLFFFYFIASADVWFIPGDNHEQNRITSFCRTICRKCVPRINSKDTKQLPWTLLYSIFYVGGLVQVTSHRVSFSICTKIGIFIILSIMLSQCLFIPLNPLSANPTKWSNTVQQFVANLPTNFLGRFDHFVRLGLQV